MKKILLTLLYFHLSILLFGQQTYVPDDNFEQALINLGYDNILDDYVITANISSINSLDVSNQSISDLTGIEDFNDLAELLCHNNQLTTLDVSNNNSLTKLYCYYNQINSININNNLVTLFCYNNQITNLDLSNNNNLTGLFCHNNQLTSLDVRNGNNTIISMFYAIGNSNLFCIDVDDPSWSSSNWFGIDSWTSFGINCSPGSGYTYVPDDNFEQKLISLGYDNFIDDYVITANINTITNLDVSNESIVDLTGIEDFLALNTLDCQNNQIVSLDLTNNLSLTELLSQNNSLTSLNIKNGNNTIITSFNSTGNNNLFCIKVDDPSWSNTNWLNIDPQSSFDTDCNPDCTDPSNLSAINVTNAEADLLWTDNANSNLNNIEYGITGFTQGSGTLVMGTSNNPETISSLNTETTYEFYVQSDCSVNQSQWIGPFSFTTLPTTKLTSAFCDSSVNSLTTNIKALPVTGAESYTFRFTHPISGSIIIYESPTRTVSLSNFSITYDVTYNVDVAVKLNGVIGNYGPVCQLTTPPIPTSRLINALCDDTVIGLNSTIKAIEIIGATTYIFRITNGNDVYVYGSPTRIINLSNFPLISDITYDVDVALVINNVLGPYGTVCQLTVLSIPTTQLTNGYCNTSVNSLNSEIKAISVTGADLYTFRLTDPNTGTVMTADSPSRIINLSNFAVANDITYDVDVAVTMNGVLGSYGTICQLTMPPSLTQSQLEPIYCGSTATWELNTTIKALAILGAESYTFRFTDPNTGSIITYESPIRTVNLNNFSLQNGITYDVDVAVTQNGILEPYGPICQLTTQALPLSRLQNAFCDVNFSSMSSIIKAIEVTVATNYTFRVIDPNTGWSIIYPSPIRTVNISSFGLTEGITYEIDVAITLNGTLGAYGQVCTITTPDLPLTRLVNSDCNDTASSMNDVIKAIPVDISPYIAEEYRFRITNPNTGAIMTFDSPIRTVNLNNFPGLVEGITYNIDVAVKLTSAGGGPVSAWGNYGIVCTHTTPSLPTTKLVNNHCNATANSMTSVMKAIPVETAPYIAEEYRFRMTDPITGTVIIYDSPIRTVNLQNFIGISPNTVYDVDVAVKLTSAGGGPVSAWGNYGIVCTHTTPSSSSISTNNFSKNLIQENIINFEVNISPNPILNSTILRINSEDVSTPVIISIYDATGKLIENRSINIEENREIEIGQKYIPGFYQVIVTQNNKRSMSKIIKQ